MKVEHRIILASVVLGIVVWVLATFFSAAVLHRGSFWELFLFEPVSSEFYLRSAAVAAILLFGCIFSRIVVRVRRAEALFRDLFNNSGGGVAIFVASKDGEDFLLKDMNVAAERVEERTRAEALGKSLCAVVHNAMELELLEVFRRVWSTGSAERLPPRFWLRGARINYVYRLPGGEIVAVYDDADERGFMEREIGRRTDELGRLMQEMNCLYGISKLVEKPDITMEEILQGTVEIVPMAWQYPSIACARVVALGRDFRTSNFKETPWRQRAEIMMEGDPTGFIEVSYLESRPEQDEGPFLKDERALIHMLAEQLGRTLALKQAQDAVAQQVQELERVNRDLKETQSELIHAGKLTAMGKMAAEMAHEINNPLGAIRVHIDLLSRDLTSGQFEPGEMGRMLDRIRVSVDHIAQAVSRMRLFSKQSDERYEELDLNAAIEASVSMLRPQFLKQRITIEERYATASLRFFGNANMLSQLFTNLLLNAKDAIMAKGGGGGTIRIETRQMDGGVVSASVSDDGKGMSEDVKSQIFHPFFTTKAEGTGLGMAIVKRILTAHKGGIKVESDVERGTSFIVSFPRDCRAGDRT
jgi:signal transduction histidine kinase